MNTKKIEKPGDYAGLTFKDLEIGQCFAVCDIDQLSMKTDKSKSSDGSGRTFNGFCFYNMKNVQFVQDAKVLLANMHPIEWWEN